MEKSDRLARLTEREKQCLRQWLQHKSAKEIAAELGISHHAVEKRLKMARIKLDAASSLHAARILGEAEGYGQTVAHSPDLPHHTPRLQSVFTGPLIFGAVMMSLVASALLALVMQPAGKTPASIERTFLTREYDQQLDILLGDLIAAAQIDGDGDIRLRWPVGDHRFLRPNSGLYWQISAKGHQDFPSRSLWDRKLRVGDRKRPTEMIHYDSDQFPNEPLRVAERTVRLPGGDVEWHFIVARSRKDTAIPRTAGQRP
jgi:DNA-binding CsgD family transcriptional regulator